MRWSLAAFFFLCTAFSSAAESLKAGTFNPPRAAPEITLAGSDGTEFKLSRHRGKVVALGFGYTSCPDVCPTTLAELAQVRKKLGAAAKDFQVVYVTVDPERDTAERLRQYLGAFDASFIGATGTEPQLAEVRKAYGISATRQPVKGSTTAGSATAYTVHHSSFVYFVDREGRLRALVPFGGRSIDDMAHDVRALLNSGKP
jgi:protein SCO1/2